MENALPKALLERNTLIDAVRASVLAGVIIVNMLTLSGLAYMTLDMRADMLGPVDRAAWQFLTVFFESKALAAFSFMFGLSFSMIVHKAQMRDELPTLQFLRRLLVLAAIGLFNAVFLFWADILMAYAALGLILPFAARLPAKALLTLALTLIIAGPLALALGGFDPPVPVPQGHIDSLAAYASPHFTDTIRQNWHMVFSATEGADSMLVLRFFMLSGLFLLGLYAGQSGLITRLTENRSTLLKTGAALLVAGGAMNLILVSGLDTGTMAPLLQVNSPVMALGYLALLAVALDSARARVLRALLAPLGRMSLTGYLMSAAMGQLLFYGWGFQFIGHLGTVQVLLVAALIFAILVAFARFWFRHFLYGPWEWLWRSLTRMQMQPLLAQPATR